MVTFGNPLSPCQLQIPDLNNLDLVDFELDEDKPAIDWVCHLRLDGRQCQPLLTSRQRVPFGEVCFFCSSAVQWWDRLNQNPPSILVRCSRYDSGCPSLYRHDNPQERVTGERWDTTPHQRVMWHWWRQASRELYKAHRKLPRTRAKDAYDHFFGYHEPTDASMADVDHVWTTFSPSWYANNRFPQPVHFLYNYVDDRRAVQWAHQFNLDSALEVKESGEYNAMKTKYAAHNCPRGVTITGGEWPAGTAMYTPPGGRACLYQLPAPHQTSPPLGPTQGRGGRGGRSGHRGGGGSRGGSGGRGGFGRGG
jgi:uncharacterized membrane protein YgcG